LAYSFSVYIILQENTYQYLFTAASFTYQNEAVIPQVRTTHCGLQSFRFADAKLWNELPKCFGKTGTFSTRDLRFSDDIFESSN
jgi:hypothetical protein